MANGTLSILASVWASSVLPEPVGPSSRMLDLASSTTVVPAALTGLDPLVVVVDRHREGLLRLVLTDHVGVEELVDLPRLGQVCPT